MTRVLVVEDEPEIRGIMAEALADEGYEVASAVDGMTALELCARKLTTWRWST